jgi:hypothetical protein
MEWINFKEKHPNNDDLILVTNNSYIELCYYENGEIFKPWRYDEQDTPVFRLKYYNGDLFWFKVDLPNKE